MTYFYSIELLYDVWVIKCGNLHWFDLSQIKLLGQSLYYLLTTGSGQQTLGEEYCDISQVITSFSSLALFFIFFLFFYSAIWFSIMVYVALYLQILLCFIKLPLWFSSTYLLDMCYFFVLYSNYRDHGTRQVLTP